MILHTLRLAEQIKAHTFTRTYEAVVYGSLREDSGTVDAPIGRHPVERKKNGGYTAAFPFCCHAL